MKFLLLNPNVEYRTFNVECRSEIFFRCRVHPSGETPRSVRAGFLPHLKLDKSGKTLRPDIQKIISQSVHHKSLNKL